MDAFSYVKKLANGNLMLVINNELLQQKRHEFQAKHMSDKKFNNDINKMHNYLDGHESGFITAELMRFYFSDNDAIDYRKDAPKHKLTVVNDYSKCAKEYRVKPYDVPYLMSSIFATVGDEALVQLVSAEFNRQTEDSVIHVNMSTDPFNQIDYDLSVGIDNMPNFARVSLE